MLGIGRPVSAIVKSIVTLPFVRALSQYNTLAGVMISRDKSHWLLDEIRREIRQEIPKEKRIELEKDLYLAYFSRIVYVALLKNKISKHPVAYEWIMRFVTPCDRMEGDLKTIKTRFANQRARDWLKWHEDTYPRSNLRNAWPGIFERVSWYPGCPQEIRSYEEEIQVINDGTRDWIEGNIQPLIEKWNRHSDDNLPTIPPLCEVQSQLTAQWENDCTDVFSETRPC